MGPFSERLIWGIFLLKKTLWPNYGCLKRMQMDKDVTVYRALCSLVSFLGPFCAIWCLSSIKKTRVSRGFGSFCATAICFMHGIFAALWALWPKILRMVSISGYLPEHEPILHASIHKKLVWGKCRFPAHGVRAGPRAGLRGGGQPSK